MAGMKGPSADPQARSAIYGTLTLGGEAWTNQLLALSPTGPAVNHTAFEWSHETRTDRLGRFRFTDVEPRLWQIWLRTPSPSDAAELERIFGRPFAVDFALGRRLGTVELSPNETVQMDLHKQGRIVVGKAVLSEPSRPVDWRAADLTMRMPNRGVKTPNPWTGAHPRSNGSFTIPCFEPGEYDLALTANGFPSTGPSRHLDMIGAAERLRVTVAMNLADGLEPLDLGRILVTPRDPLRIGEQAVDFRLPTLDGGTFELKDYLGRATLLAFGPYSSGGLADFKELSRIYGEKGGKTLPRVVGICVGWEGEDPFREIEEARFPWPMLDVSGHVEFFRGRYEVFWTTDFILLDAEGRVMARHYRAEGILQAIERHLASEVSNPGQRAASAQAEKQSPRDGRSVRANPADGTLTFESAAGNEVEGGLEGAPWR